MSPASVSVHVHTAAQPCHALRASLPHPQEMGLAPLLPLRTRVVNGWDNCCTGHVCLDLSKQVGAGGGGCGRVCLDLRQAVACIDGASAGRALGYSQHAATRVPGGQ